MGFSVSRRIVEKVLQIVNATKWDDLADVTPIPDANGLVLVKAESQAFFERKEEKGVFLIPLTLQGSEEDEPDLNFFVCTK